MAESRGMPDRIDDQRRGTFTPSHAQDFGAAKYQRANVTRWLTVAADGFLNGIGNFLMRPGQVHARNLATVDQPPNVRFQTEDRRALCCFVATYPFKRAGTVVQNVRCDMHVGLVPSD